jgi:hypothetical protein
VIGAVVLANVAPMAGATHSAVHLAMTTGGEVAIVAIIFGTVSGMVYPLVRAWARRLESRGASTLPLQHVEDRLDRIERAVESIALEVERVSEGQRFVTKLLAEKTPPQIPPASP